MGRAAGLASGLSTVSASEGYAQLAALRSPQKAATNPPTDGSPLTLRLTRSVLYPYQFLGVFHSRSQFRPRVLPPDVCAAWDGPSNATRLSTNATTCYCRLDESPEIPSLIIADNDPSLQFVTMPVAETLGVVGSIIAIVQISKTIISLCEFYIDEVDGASSDLQVILIEISALKGIAKSLQYLTQLNVANSALLNQLAAVTGPIEGCKKALKELEALFPSVAASMNNQRTKRRKLDAAVATLAWPLKKGKAKRLLQIIMQHKTTINLALTAEFVYASISCPLLGSFVV